MKQFICSICGYIYDEAQGIPEAGIAPGTVWEQLPDDWTCPLCGASKAEFKEASAEPQPKAASIKPIVQTEEHELTAAELSAVCSNLARGCEKQYKAEEAALFTQLADYFKKATPAAQAADTSKLLALVEQDLSREYPVVNAVAAEEKDRGAMRALVWSEKVTRILKSLMVRYEKEGEAMLENTGVYVCTICGFVFVGDKPPEICPVCKVPSWKFVKIGEGALV